MALKDRKWEHYWGKKEFTVGKIITDRNKPITQRRVELQRFSANLLAVKVT